MAEYNVSTGRSYNEDYRFQDPETGAIKSVPVKVQKSVVETTTYNLGPAPHTVDQYVYMFKDFAEMPTGAKVEHYYEDQELKIRVTTG